ncbi:FAD-dependent oxidoreductase [Parasphingorhabdus sp. JC815]|uniref:flavin monoamine oxidase family protein n=1 Tax=Parasphingorhabdus sp. JC815 TaxID=3232140 RepID=UPI0034576CCA
MITRRELLIAGGAAAIAYAPASAKSSIEADAVVIGAGLSGLNAASMLEAAGAKVVVLEGSNRIGGRAYTLDNLPGHPDAGGIQIGSNYTRLIDIAQRLGVTLESGGEFDRTALYVVNGETVTQKNWPSSSANQLVGFERQLPPMALGPVLGRKLGKLDGPAAWMTDSGRKLDVPYGAALKSVGASDEAIRLISSNLGSSNINAISVLNSARSSAFYQSAGPNASLSVISGGSQRLPEAMAAALKTEVRLGQLVTGITESNDQVRVNLANGSSVIARQAICTIPFSALRSIGLSGTSADAMKGAISSLPYTHASFAYLSASEPFWKHDGLPEMIWSDDPLIGRVFVLGDDPAMLKVWLSGPAADAIDRISPTEAGAAIIARIEDARPSAKGKLRLERMFSWQRDPMARGAFYYIGAGQWQLLNHAVSTTGHRLHFAGDHLARLASGLEGALESGEQAAISALKKL